MIHPSGRKLCALELVRLFRARPLVACYHRDARRSQESYQRSISDRLLLKGRKNFDEEGFPRSQLHPSLGGWPWLGECLFWFVFSPQLYQPVLNIFHRDSATLHPIDVKRRYATEIHRTRPYLVLYKFSQTG